MSYEVTLGGHAARSVDAVRHGDSATVVIDGRAHRAALHADADGHRLILGDVVERLHLAVRGDTVLVHAFGRAWELQIVDPVERSRAAGPSSDVLGAPMPGTVISVAVAAGETVHVGQPLVVIESMKMQSEIIAPRDGVLAAVHVAVGETFDRGAPLVALEPQPDGEVA